MCDTTVENYAHALKFFSDCCKPQKCVIKLSIMY